MKNKYILKHDGIYEIETNGHYQDYDEDKIYNADVFFKKDFSKLVKKYLLKKYRKLAHNL